ncbi:2033_t:CDS:2 [Entrophospora sp. SA101]|nr:2033_t:CDS:2 [Entrophospora sp. SA101]
MPKEEDNSTMRLHALLYEFERCRLFKRSSIAGIFLRLEMYYSEKSEISTIIKDIKALSFQTFDTNSYEQ